MIYTIIPLTIIFLLGILLILKGTDSKSRLRKIAGGLVSLGSWYTMMTLFI